MSASLISNQTEVPLTIRLFGAIEVHVHGRPLEPLRTRKDLWLLALLTLRSSQNVDRDWLAGLFWPDSEEERALYYLRRSLSNLRGALGEEAPRLTSPAPRALRLDLTGAEVDVLAFDRAVATGRERDLQEAVVRYRGPLLEGCLEEWVFPERNTREQNCLSALRALAVKASDRQAWEEAVGYLRSALTIDSLQEATQRSLMEALAAQGNPAAAIEVYRTYRLLLHEELQAAPDSQTQALYSRIRSEARRPTRISLPSSSDAERSTSDVHEPGMRTGYLPQPLTLLIGREREREAIVSSLSDSRLVTLVGPGGIGKTRLALEVAREVAGFFDEGVWFVDLAPLAEPDLIPQTIATRLGISEKAGEEQLETLRHSLSSRQVLLVLDNCEHLLKACARIAAALLGAGSGVRILATSREPVSLPGEVLWPVPTLACPPIQFEGSISQRGMEREDKILLPSLLLEYEAVRLLVERLRQAQPGFQITPQNAPFVAAICRRLDGIPLALELVANRIRTLTVEQIASRLDDRFRLVAGGNRAALPRHQTLRALLDWSYDLLTEEERHLLACLSVFAGGWTLEAAEAIASFRDEGKGMRDAEHLNSQRPTPNASTPAVNSSLFPLPSSLDVLDLLCSLVDKSLVSREEGRSDVRYRMLETIRQYALEKLVLSGEAEAICQRHYDWYLVFCDNANANISGVEQGRWLDGLEAEHDNLRAALEWRLKAQEEASPGVVCAVQMAGALARFWEMHGHFAEGRSYLRRALEQDKTRMPTRARETALIGAGVLAYRQSDLVSAQVLFQESLAAGRELGHNRGIASSLNHLGNVAYSSSRFEAARAYYEEGLAMAKEIGDRRHMAMCLSNLGNAALSLAEYDPARTFYRESLRIHKEGSDKDNIAWTLHSLGVSAVYQGDYNEAQALYEECLAIFRELGDRLGIAYSLQNLGEVLQELRDLVTAQAMFEESLIISRDLGDRLCIAASLNNLATIMSDQGDLVTARRMYGESLTIKRDVGDKSGAADSLEEVAAMLLSSDVEEAVRLWGASQVLRESIRAPHPPNKRERYEKRVAEARSALGADAFHTLWEEGRTLDWEQAIQAVLGEDSRAVVHSIKS